MSRSIVDDITQTRTSSVLNKDTKQFGKKHLFDKDNETCWNSDQGSPQWIMVTFQQPVKIDEIHIHFQGGFVGKNCRLEGSLRQDKELKPFFSFSPQDISQLQKFPIEDVHTVDSVKVVFESSTDFFGRITIYKLDILGCSSSL